MRQVVWSDDALRDFDQVILQIARDNRRAASEVADRIDAAVALLAERPVGHPGRVTGTYEKLVLRTSYIIAYALSDHAVTIPRIVHSRRDWQLDQWPER